MTIIVRRRNFWPETLFDLPVACAFWILSIFILINPRGLFPHGDRNGLVVVAFQCVCCLVVICLARVRPIRALGSPGVLIVCAFLSYLFIGFTISIGVGAEVRVDMNRILRNNLFFLSALLAVTCGSRVVLARMNIHVFLRCVLIMMIASCVITLISSILRYFELIPPSLFPGRLTGFHPSPNEVGLIGCATSVVALSCFGISKSAKLEHLGLSIGFLTVLMSLSKTGILMSIAVFLLFLIFLGDQRCRRAIITWISVSLIFFVVMIGLLNLGNIVEEIVLNQERLIQIFLLFSEGKINEDLLTGRGILWNMGLQLALDSPLYGNGIGQLRYMEGAPPRWDNQGPYGVHNMYLLLIGEAGFLPLSLYLMHMLSLIRLWWTAPKSAARDMIVGWTVMIVLFGFSSHHLFDLWIYALLCGLTCAIGTAVAEAHRGKPIPR